MESKNILKLEDLIKLADEKYLEIIDNGQITDLLKAIGRFSDQTISNDVLILAQNPNATCVKRMKEWNYYSRSVIKNEKSIKIISHRLDKVNNSYEDEKGNVYSDDVEKLRPDIGYLFDISQTEGKEYPYLNTNKENIARFFESAKSALERTAKGYEFKYVDQEPYAKMDKENKIIYIKDGLSIDELLNTLVNQTTRVLLDSRKPEGLTSEDKPNIDEIEYNYALYAIKSKLGLNLPDFDYDQIKDYTKAQKIDFSQNLQKVRSVTKQLLSNFDRSIEIAVRDLEKKIAEQEAPAEVETKQEEVAPVKTTTTKRKTKAKQAESEVQ